MTIYYLTVALLINGVWTDGNTLDGWAAMQMRDLRHCLHVMNRANAMPVPPEIGAEDVLFTCVGVTVGE